MTAVSSGSLMIVVVCAITPAAAASNATMGMNRGECFISRDFGAVVDVSDVRRDD